MADFGDKHMKKSCLVGGCQASTPWCLPVQAQETLLLPAERQDQLCACDPPAVQGLSGRCVPPDQLITGVAADPVPLEQLVPWGESSGCNNSKNDRGTRGWRKVCQFTAPVRQPRSWAGKGAGSLGASDDREHGSSPHHGATSAPCLCVAGVWLGGERFSRPWQGISGIQAGKGVNHP
jgi:hypothetical protein